MGLLDRVALLLRANLNDMIDRAEDPEIVVKQVLADLQNQLIQVKTQVAVAIGDEQHLYSLYQDQLAQVQQWQSRAELAVEKNDDTLAREALLRRNTARENARVYGAQWEEQQRQVELLKTAMSRLKDKIDEAERKLELLLTRRRRIETERAIAGILGNVNDGSALAQLDNLQQQTELDEVRAHALLNMNNQPSLEERFAELERQGEIDRDLATLKARIKQPVITDLPAEQLNPPAALHDQAEAITLESSEEVEANQKHE